MDLSTLELPLRSERKKANLFGLPPTVSSVNISYETAEAHLESISDRSGSPTAREVPRRMSTPNCRQSTPESRYRMQRNNSSAAVPSYSLLTPTKNTSSEANADSTVSIRSRSRSNASIASEECQSFITSLKEPKYNKPLSADEIAWLFQDFYSKLRRDLLGSDFELRSLDEMDTRKQLEREIDSILDRVEKVVAGGELYQKLFSLGYNRDVALNARIFAFRDHKWLMHELHVQLDLIDKTSPNTPELVRDSLTETDSQDVKSKEYSNESRDSEDRDVLEQQKEIDENIGPLELNLNPDLSSVFHFLNKINKETSPKSKLSALVKAHHALVEALEKEKDADADSVLPFFISALVQSEADNWWQNFLFIRRFRRSSEVTGQAAYCLTNLEAAIMFVEKMTVENIPADVNVDPQLFIKPIENPKTTSRSRSSSQSSKVSVSSSSTNLGPLSSRIGETLSSYRSMLLSARRPSQSLPFIDQRFMQMDADSLTMADVRVLLKEYKRLAEYVEKKH